VLLRRKDGGHEKAMIKTVYGPPPTGEERIEAAEEQTDSGILEEVDGKCAGHDPMPQKGGQQ